MILTQKQLSLNRRTSRKQFPISIRRSTHIGTSASRASNLRRFEADFSQSLNSTTTPANLISHSVKVADIVADLEPALVQFSATEDDIRESTTKQVLNPL